MQRNLDPQIIAASILQGDQLALARACTDVENDSPAGEKIISILYKNSGKAHIVGITGSPGTGKSSLVNQLVREYRKQHPADKVAVIAVDPTSPFSGGAVLGDRVRMHDLAGDERIFIRSMATRGALGGLSRQTTSLALLFDCAGYALVIIETVGAGQSEVDIVRLAHTTIVVEAPGMGDDIQAIKAGILEIADILVVNKADHPGADSTERSLKLMLEMARDRRPEWGDSENDARTWDIPVVQTIAIENQGILDVLVEMEKHRQWMKTNGRWSAKEQQRLKADIINRLKDRLYSHWQADYSEIELEEVIQRVFERQVSPFQAVEQLLSQGRSD